MKNKGARVDEEFAKKAQEIMKIRLEKGLAKFNQRELSLREFTNLALKTQSWKGVELELKNKPKIRK